MSRVLVAGASGRVGHHVARRLRAQGRALRLLLRPEEARGFCPEDGDEVVTGDFNSPDSMAEAFTGVDAAFMYAPDADASPAVFGAARACAVQRIVMLSSASVVKAPPGPNPIAERHRAAEAAVRAASLGFTFIRPDTMASNCLQWVQSIRADGCVYTACPNSMRNPVHEDDVALLAALALQSDAHAGRAYFVTGPQVLRIRDQVDAIAAQLGETITCVRIEEEDALARSMLASPGLSRAAAQRLLDYLRKSVTVKPDVSDEFGEATGCAPRPFSDWVCDHLDAFRRPAN